MSIHLFISLSFPSRTQHRLFISPVILRHLLLFPWVAPGAVVLPNKPWRYRIGLQGERCCVMFQLPCDEPKGANIDRQFSLSLPPSLPSLSRFSYYSQTRQIRVTGDENGTKWNIFPPLFSPPHSFLSFSLLCTLLSMRMQPPFHQGK